MFIDGSQYAWVLGLAGLGVAFFVFRSIVARPTGTPAMADLAEQIQSGAMAFLRAEYTVLLPFMVLVAALLAWALNARTAAAFVGGAPCSIAAGYFGMIAATRANVRTAEAARAGGQGPALRVAFLGGSVMGLSVASLGLLGLGMLFMLLARGLAADHEFK